MSFNYSSRYRTINYCSFYLTQPFIKSIQDISDGAEKIREGNFNDQLKGSKIVELHTMAVNFNEMNNQLQKHFNI
ncbi:HAMP domain-containing protein [Bacillus megaterium]|nr:HAMP domain-containing protein [Priestia megaterium]